MLGLMDTLTIPRFGSLNPGKAHLMELLAEHNRAVQAFLLSEKLLVYEVKDGWKPLCDFLGQPVPDTPFPFENQGEDFIKQTLGRFVKGDVTRTG